jgi:D-threo-aldose 1-dehydrogenase
VPARNEVYDYSYDGVMRSVEFSLERLGVDRIDILFAHDSTCPITARQANARRQARSS